MTVLLRGADLWTIVEGTEPRPEKDADAWTKRHGKAMAMLYRTLADNELELILDLDSVSAAWKKHRLLDVPQETGRHNDDAS